MTTTDTSIRRDSLSRVPLCGEPAQYGDTVNFIQPGDQIARRALIVNGGPDHLVLDLDSQWEGNNRLLWPIARAEALIVDEMDRAYRRDQALNQACREAVSALVLVRSMTASSRQDGLSEVIDDVSERLAREMQGITNRWA